MKITVVTVCYNVALTIESTIQSVINQTYKNIEYIIIDGGSKDGTVDVIKKYSDCITYWISEPDRGIYDAMNKGLNRATGDYINFMNAGDIFTSANVVEDVVKRISQKDDVIYGDSACAKSDGTTVLYPVTMDIGRLSQGPVYRHNASFTKTSVHKKVPFDLSLKEKFKYALDYNQIFNMWRLGYKFRHIDVNVVIYEEVGISYQPMQNMILNFRIAHQYEKPTISEYFKLIVTTVKLTLRKFLFNL